MVVLIAKGTQGIFTKSPDTLGMGITDEKFQTEYAFPVGGGVLGLRTYGDVPLENLKSYLSRSQIPENDTLSWSKIFLNNTLSFSFFGQSCALKGNMCEIYRKM